MSVDAADAWGKPVGQNRRQPWPSEGRERDGRWRGWWACEAGSERREHGVEQSQHPEAPRLLPKCPGADLVRGLHLGDDPGPLLCLRGPSHLSVQRNTGQPPFLLYETLTWPAPQGPAGLKTGLRPQPSHPMCQPPTQYHGHLYTPEAEGIHPGHPEHGRWGFLSCFFKKYFGGQF